MSNGKFRPRPPYGQTLEGVGLPVITAEGDYYPIVVFDRETASIVGEFWATFQLAMNDRPRYEHRLAKFRDLTVRDILGNELTLLASLDALIQFHYEMDEEERTRFEREFYHPRVQVTR